MQAFIVNLNYPTQLFQVRSKRLNHPDHPVSVARVGSLSELHWIRLLCFWKVKRQFFISRSPLLMLALHNFKSKGV